MQRVLLFGTENIARHHVQEFSAIAEADIVLCADLVPGRAEAFAAEHGIASAFASLDQAIAWGDFNAAVNATPDGVHVLTTLALIAAGKHVLCEKPLAPNYADALMMVEAAETAGLINMVNFTYRNAPALEAARAMVAGGEIGTLRHVGADYLQSWLVGRYWGDWRTGEKWLWRLSRRHGSTGVLGDVGVHILDYATHAAARGSPASMLTSPPSPKPRAMRLATMSSTPMIASPSSAGSPGAPWSQRRRPAMPPATPMTSC